MTTMKRFFIEAVGLAAPGLLGWESSKSVLAGGAYVPQPLEKYKPQNLPPNERRRATQLVRLAFRACEDVMQQSALDAKHLATVFSSSGGDYPIIDQICTALCGKDRGVSPTQFHNSVHNSAAGYWSIGVGSDQPSCSLSAYDDSLAMGFIEAASLVLVDEYSVLLAVYDTQPPEPLQAKRAITEDFSVAFVLTPEPSEQSLASVVLSVIEESQSTPVEHGELAGLFQANPAARALPLLELLAQQSEGSIVLAMPSQQSLRLDIKPCC